MSIKIKICGMRDLQNIEKIARLSPDFMGFIFYEKSPRNVTHTLPKISQSVQKVGVFVNADLNFIREKIKNYHLQVVQLHGKETPQFCNEIQKLGVKVWKVFNVDNHFNFDRVKPYVSCCEYFVFDAKGKAYGGNGIKFNWDNLKKYTEKIPFLLSGGVSLQDIETLKYFRHAQMVGVDVNSKFEISPAVKDRYKLEIFIRKLRTV